jgi:hypothetical protein
VLGIAAVLASTVAVANNLTVAEIGSFHVAGRPVSLSGLPTKDVVFTAGSAPIKSRSTPTATSRSSRCTCST